MYEDSDDELCVKLLDKAENNDLCKSMMHFICLVSKIKIFIVFKCAIALYNNIFNEMYIDTKYKKYGFYI